MLIGAAAYLLCSVLAVPAAGHAGSVSRQTLEGGCTKAAIETPAEAAPVDSGGGRLVSVAAADVDGDGDLDVLALDASLHLLLWTNDGAGHLTRKLPRAPASDRAIAHPPRLDTQPVGIIRAMGSDDPLARRDRLPNTTFSIRGQPHAVDVVRPDPTADGGRASRAPPASSSLA